MLSLERARGGSDCGMMVGELRELVESEGYLRSTKVERRLSNSLQPTDDDPMFGSLFSFEAEDKLGFCCEL